MPQKEEPVGTPERRKLDDRAYEAPELRELGTIAELTLDAVPSTLDDTHS